MDSHGDVHDGPDAALTELTRTELAAEVIRLRRIVVKSHFGYGKCHDVHGIHPRACDICKEALKDGRRYRPDR